MASEDKPHVDAFNPVLGTLDSAEDAELESFHAGEGFWTFDQYIQRREGKPSEAEQDSAAGKGATHLIWNALPDGGRELVGYFTLCMNAIPYDDGIEDEGEGLDFSNFPCITVLEIKMFAVSVKYQDVFFMAYDTDLPVSAWCLQAIITYADELSRICAGFQALFLHAVPSAEHFYEQNGFSCIPSAARPLFSIDQDLRAMWLPLRECAIPLDA